MRVVCGGVGQKVRSGMRRRAKPACLRRSASPCQYAPPQDIDMLKYIPKQLYNLLEELVVLFCHCVVCAVVWNRKYRCSGIAARSGLASAPPPLLRYRSPVMMSRAPSEPQDDSHVLVEGPICAYHCARGSGVGAGAEEGVGGECRRKCSSPGPRCGRGGLVEHASYVRSMLSM